ncbi:MAG: organic hydroperoxide reductase OsmC/OhrA [Pontimonas sp.]|jgi:organic hydroperoxide reductase OsmC/OhrA
MTEHFFAVSVTWTGNKGTGTSGYKDYDRSHFVSSEGKEAIAGSADKVFHGDQSRWNPEEMLIAALSQCHMLSFLHVASAAGITIQKYSDNATGTLVLFGDGGGRMSEVTLRPSIEISSGDRSLVPGLHHRASELCFIANSVSFPVRHEAHTVVSPSH